MSIFLTLEHVRDICFEYAKTYLAHNEPIPPFEKRYPHQLETALAAPLQTFGGNLLYETFELQAAVLFYEMIKLHPFENGNKRIATVSLMVFMFLNGKWLKTNWRELYDAAIDVAKSTPKERPEILKTLNLFISANSINQ